MEPCLSYNTIYCNNIYIYICIYVYICRLFRFFGRTSFFTSHPPASGRRVFRLAWLRSVASRLEERLTEATSELATARWEITSQEQKAKLVSCDLDARRARGKRVCLFFIFFGGEGIFFSLGGVPGLFKGKTCLFLRESRSPRANTSERES